ncbi:FAD-dependent oxidoreductase [Halococcus dombrowskii]|uniref:FAD-dependent oxidoreductase n=1 Tax=Halococcus dombrowskii TaxID=179637 RepID=A0AAV3SHW1_HALDO|nr:NAD(P)/FAD-dependent oxidoreductase [Halococcus dombrowskii]UOO93947.1 FAD-dependent oxidoreductase [Halococcus dombrowskii]
MTQVTVVGGGLAGLVAARHLAADGADVELLERRESVGGRVRSRQIDGYTFDRGFQVLFTGYPAAQRELDYRDLDLQYFTPGATLARPGSRSVLADPRRDPASLTETLFNANVSFGDMTSLLGLWRELANEDESEVFVGEDESIDEFLRDRGFSNRFIERFFAPFYGGITLDRTLATSAAVFRYTFRMLAGGSIAVPAAGMGAIADQLADAAREAGVEITLDSEVEAIEGARDGVAVELAGESRETDAVVVAADPKQASELIDVASIPTDARGCVTQYLSLPTHQRLDTGKKLLLNAGGTEPNHVAPLSAVAPDYSPAGRELLSATFLGEQDRSDEELAKRTREALGAWYPERRFDDLELLATDRIPFAQFAQPPGFYRDLPSTNAPDGNVYLAGDYTNWSSIQGALESGRTAAHAVLDS